MARTATERDCAAATCATCIFGRGITIEDKNRKGEVVATREMAECHVARPTRFGFPVVRLDDFCSMHVDRASAERTFAGLVPQSMSII